MVCRIINCATLWSAVLHKLIYSHQVFKVRPRASETDGCNTDVYKPFNLSIASLEVVHHLFYGALILSILYAWKIILNIPSRTRDAKYFRSVKTGLMFKDCPLTASMTLPARLRSWRLHCIIPRVPSDATLWYSRKTKWKTWSFTSPSLPPPRQAGAPCLEDIWLCLSTPCSEGAVQGLFPPSFMPCHVLCTTPCRWPLTMWHNFLFFLSHLFVYRP